MGTNRYKLLWTITFLLVILLFLFFLKDFYRLSKNGVLNIFLLLLLSIFVINFISFFCYKILKLKPKFPLNKLEKDEKLVFNPIITDVVVSLKNFNVRFSRDMIAFTNKRYIVASNFFGFWSFLIPTNYWFKQNLANKKICNITLSEDKSHIIINTDYRKIKVYLKNAEEVFESTKP